MFSFFAILALHLVIDQASQNSLMEKKYMLHNDFFKFYFTFHLQNIIIYYIYYLKSKQHLNNIFTLEQETV